MKETIVNSKIEKKEKNIKKKKSPVPAASNSSLGTEFSQTELI